jgi:hypothetical protein
VTLIISQQNTAAAYPSQNWPIIAFSQRVEESPRRPFYFRQLKKGGSASPKMPVRLGPTANTTAEGARLTYSLFFFAIGDLESTI